MAETEEERPALVRRTTAILGRKSERQHIRKAVTRIPDEGTTLVAEAEKEIENEEGGNDEEKKEAKKKKKKFLYPLIPERPPPDPNDIEILKPREIPIKCTRDRITMELLTTEQTYVKNLQVLVQVFKDPIAHRILDGTLGLSEANFHVIFSNVEEILAVNVRFLSSLIERLKDWSDEQQIGDVVMQVTNELRLYIVYSLAFQEATKIVADFEKKEKNILFLEKQGESPLCQGLEFSAFLIMPIQRIPRYNMLIAEIIKQTPENHSDLANLKASLSALQDVALEINEAVRESERQARLNKIARNFLDAREKSIRQPGRHFFHDGELHKVCRKENRVRHFFLFSDCFINAATTQNKFTISRQLDLTHFCVESFPDSDNYKNAFAIKHEERSFIVFAESPLAKTQWMAAFKQALGDTLSTPGLDRDRLAPLWMPDDATKVCLICSVKFTTFNRRHHCRQCGMVVCGKCSNNDKYILGKGKKVRVCSVCFAVTPVNPVPEDAAKANTRVKKKSKKHDSDSDSTTESSDSSDSDSSSVSVLFTCVAIHDYQPASLTAASSTGEDNSSASEKHKEKGKSAKGQRTKKLAFSAGDTLGIVYRDTSGWWVAERQGERGWVPSSFLFMPRELA